MTSKTNTAAVDIEEVRRQLEEWRGSHARRARLPEQLWAAAVAVARQQGLYQTARALRLDYTRLKQRLQGSAGAKASALPAFVELIAPGGTNVSEWVVEMEGRRGGKVRIQWKAAVPPDLVGLSRILWGRQA